MENTGYRGYRGYGIAVTKLPAPNQNRFNLTGLSASSHDTMNKTQTDGALRIERRAATTRFHWTIFPIADCVGAPQAVITAARHELLERLPARFKGTFNELQGDITVTNADAALTHDLLRWYLRLLLLWPAGGAMRFIDGAIDLSHLAPGEPKVMPKRTRGIELLEKLRRADDTLAFVAYELDDAHRQAVLAAVAEWKGVVTDLSRFTLKRERAIEQIIATGAAALPKVLGDAGAGAGAREPAQDRPGRRRTVQKRNAGQHG